MNIVIGWIILQSIIWCFLGFILCITLGFIQPYKPITEHIFICKVLIKVFSIITALIILAIKLIWFWS
jgi:hypothetical protein